MRLIAMMILCFVCNACGDESSDTKPVNQESLTAVTTLTLNGYIWRMPSNGGTASYLASEIPKGDTVKSFKVFRRSSWSTIDLGFTVVKPNDAEWSLVKELVAQSFDLNNYYLLRLGDDTATVDLSKIGQVETLESGSKAKIKIEIREL